MIARRLAHEVELLSVTLAACYGCQQNAKLIGLRKLFETFEQPLNLRIRHAEAEQTRALGAKPLTLQDEILPRPTGIEMAFHDSACFAVNANPGLRGGYCGVEMYRHLVPQSQ